MLCISAAPLSLGQVELKLHLALTTPRKATLSGAAEIISFHLWCNIRLLASGVGSRAAFRVCVMLFSAIKLCSDFKYLLQ